MSTTLPIQGKQLIIPGELAATNPLATPEPSTTNNVDSIERYPETVISEKKPATCCLLGCWIYIKDKVACFFSWICSIFTSSKFVTEEIIIKELEAVTKPLMTAIMEIEIGRYFFVTKESLGTQDAALACLWDYSKIYMPLMECVLIVGALVKSVNLTSNGSIGNLPKILLFNTPLVNICLEMEKSNNIKDENILITRDDLIKEKNRIRNLLNNIEDYCNKTFPVPNKCTPEMRQLLEEYCLGKIKLAGKAVVTPADLIQGVCLCVQRSKSEDIEASLNAAINSFTLELGTNEQVDNIK
jgi:hypothetical protein